MFIPNQAHLNLEYFYMSIHMYKNYMLHMHI